MDHPIPCTGSVVRAILADRQTQDRRPILVKRRPFLARDWAKAIQLADGTWSFWYPGDVTEEFAQQAYPNGGGVKQPWQVGDHLWVRETWALALCEKQAKETLTGQSFHDVLHIIRDMEYDIEVGYRATNPDYLRTSEAAGEFPHGWCPSIHMPKWAARIWLEVLDVRPEQDATGVWVWVTEFRRMEG